MSDKFKDHLTGLESPPTGGFAITPDDATNLPQITRALNAGVSGSVRVTLLDESEVTLYIVAGSMLPLRVKRVWATGTTASSLAGLF